MWKEQLGGEEYWSIKLTIYLSIKQVQINETSYKPLKLK